MDRTRLPCRPFCLTAEHLDSQTGKNGFLSHPEKACSAAALSAEEQELFDVLLEKMISRM